MCDLNMPTYGGSDITIINELEVFSRKNRALM